MLLNEQILQSGFLIGAALQNEHDPVHRQVWWRRALVILRPRERVSVPGEVSEPRDIHSIRNSRRDGVGLGGGCQRRDQRQSAAQQ